MPVAVVQVRHVRMVVGGRRVIVRVRVPALHRRVVVVVVPIVVSMCVLVLQRGVLVLVPVAWSLLRRRGAAAKSVDLCARGGRLVGGHRAVWPGARGAD